MPNRFTATEKWVDPWFCGLNEKDKLFWIYILDNCNHAGIWQVNWPLTKFHIKDYVYKKEVFKGRIVELSENKWFVPKFISFQYKTGLNPENRAHASVISILEKEGAYKGLVSPFKGRKDMDKDKVKVKENTTPINNTNNDMQKSSIKHNINKEWFNSIWLKYPNKDGKREAERHFQTSVKTEQDFTDINKALDKYLIHLKYNEWKKPKNGSTWFNNWQDWVNWVEPESTEHPEEKTEKQIKGKVVPGIKETNGYIKSFTHRI